MSKLQPQYMSKITLKRGNIKRIDLDIYLVNWGRIYCNLEVYIVFEYVNTIFRHFEPI